MISFLGYDIPKLKGLGGDLTAKEILQQPDLWLETYQLIVRQRDEISAFMEKINKEKGIRIIFTGAGSSAFVGDAVTPYLSRKMGCNVESIATTDLVTNPDNYLFSDIPTLLISCARSGNSPESVATVQLAEKIVKNLYQLVITCNPNGELAKQTRGNQKALLVLMPEDSNDKGFAMTGSFTTMVLSSLLIFSEPKLEEYKSLVEKIAAHGKKMMKTNSINEAIKDLAQSNFNRGIYLGSSCLKGLAQEASLKMLELTAGSVNTDSNSALGFRHGPKSVVNEETVVVFCISSDAYTRQYELDLLKEMASENKAQKLICFTPIDDEEVRSLADLTIFIGEGIEKEIDDVILLFPNVLIAQMLAFQKAITLGITPDNPCPSGTVNRVVKGVVIYPFNLRPVS
ncbi:SIS domain-containing protein [Alkaliphilus peptidifermentans]|uniref:Tagatose-6-phosphate ketose/aldose isomerase n=1 Tax=Alkaliphilus peptidifermentans DSM 18978 TaxID=1120976 RepID=A0A1G5FXR6_9FIRM|nr:SIS domain-containing protein [Alkaliphilus peptidifermentans]SCY44135.1 tagatose-6-phosphate ketose/aldose isomerase [Alkaliphilus peptidifermentans DSM 18978]